MNGERAAALKAAYALIEAAQGEIGLAEVEERAGLIGRPHWGDVRLLLTFARSLAVRDAGEDDSAYVREMLDIAAGLDDPALCALALATSASRRADSKRALDLGESVASPLVRAVGLLDQPSAGPAVHRAGALIEIGCVSHAMGLWELAIEHYDLTEAALAESDDPRWAHTVRRQRLVLALNRVELILDWACAHAIVGEHASAVARAATALRPDAFELIGDDWPASWVQQYLGHLHLLATLAGRDLPHPLPESGPHPLPESGPRPLPAHQLRPGIAELVAALRADQAGDVAGAARLADGLADRLVAVPTHTRMLAMHLASRQPGTPPIALRYAAELATLRWNDRLHRMANIHSAIAVERRRREHEQLRRDLLTDDLTGLANRRGYHAYLDSRPEPADHDGYAVLMVDVDHFKAVNDGFGHDVGDLVLARIAGILAEHVRGSDLAARLGGDEFVVILAEVPADVPGLRAQNIIDAVRRHPWHDLADGLEVTVSIGVHHGGRRELPALLAEADRSLYRAKNEGRGRYARL